MIYIFIPWFVIIAAIAFLVIVAKEVVDAIIGLLIFGFIFLIVVYLSKRYPKMSNMLAFILLCLMAGVIVVPPIYEYVRLDNTLKNIIGNNYAITNSQTPELLAPGSSYKITVVKVIDKNKVKIISGKYRWGYGKKGWIWKWNNKKNVVYEEKICSFKLKWSFFNGAYLNVKGKKIFIEKNEKISNGRIYRQNKENSKEFFPKPA